MHLNRTLGHTNPSIVILLVLLLECPRSLLLPLQCLLDKTLGRQEPTIHDRTHRDQSRFCTGVYSTWCRFTLPRMFSCRKKGGREGGQQQQQ